MFNFTDYHGKINIGPYLVAQNECGLGAIINKAPYSQNMSGNETLPLSVKWDWNWPHLIDSIKSYPEIIYGYGPWEVLTTTPILPKKVSDIGDFIVTFDVSTTSTGSYDTAFDIWMASTNPPTVDTITDEIMIWLNRTMGPTPNEYVGYATIDGVQYGYVHSHVNYNNLNGGWNGVTFLAVNPVSSGVINVTHFFDFMVANGLVSPNNYLISIEFGNEINYGIGQTTINHYDIAYKEKQIMSTTIPLTGISSGNTPATPIAITAVAADPTLFDSAVVNYTDPATTGNIVLTPKPGASGSTTVTVTADNHQPANNKTTKTFGVTVKKLNPPLIDPIADVIVYS